MSTELLTTDLPRPAPLDARRAALFLDLDGTLAPIAPRPQDVRPDARRTDVLTRLARALSGRVAVVSGRTLAEVDRVLDGSVAAVAAVHGLVRREPDGAVLMAAPHPRLAAARAKLLAFAARDEGLLVEDKRVSLTLHYRLAPQWAEDARRLARDVARSTGLSLQVGDMVDELRTPGPDKGDAVRAFMAAPPFAGARPIFVGDDATDENGFAAARALGGFGVRVGANRDTAAVYGLEDPARVLEWLEAAT